MFRHSATEFVLTAARPNLGWLDSHRGAMRVELEDVSDDYGILAVQGPRSRVVLAGLAPGMASPGSRRRRPSSDTSSTPRRRSARRR